MPPPRRRRPVQPATRVRIPRSARSRDIPGGEPAGGRLPVAEVHGTDLSPDDLTGPEPAGETLTRDEPATGESPTRDESPTGESPTRDEPPPDKPAAGEQAAGEQAAGEQAAGEQAAGEQAADKQTAGKQAADKPDADQQAAAAQEAAPGPARHPLLLPACLGALAVVLGGLAVWFGLEAAAATTGVDTSNTALTDPAATRQVTQQVTSAVNKIFSYNYADTAKTSQAAATLLTGKARQQYDTLFNLVRQDAPKEKLVLTTIVTNSGVEFLDGSRARLLIFADQRDTAGVTHKTTDAGAMFAVNAVSQGGRWKISSIDTFGAAG
jgi:Mce-associated membrane protein